MTTRKRLPVPKHVYARRRRRMATSLVCISLFSPSTAFQAPSFFRRGRARTSESIPPPLSDVPRITDTPAPTTPSSRRRHRSRLRHTLSNLTDSDTTTSSAADVLPPVSHSHWQAYTRADPNAPINVVGIDDVFEHLLGRGSSYASEPMNGVTCNGNAMRRNNGFDQSLIATTETVPLVANRTDEDTAGDDTGEEELFFARWVIPEEMSESIQLDQDDSSASLPTVRKLWKRRHARSIQEGIRRENTRTQLQLSSLLSKTTRIAPTQPGRHYAARTIHGLINALAEEADDVKVEVDARSDTPLWSKHVDSIRINFSRLGFKPLRMGGLDEAIKDLESSMPDSHKDFVADNLEELSGVSSADEAFDRIDVDKSGALDQEEIASALNLAAYDMSDAQLLEGLASELVDLYDANGDGVVDREEYQRLVADMASLRQEQQRKQDEVEERQQNDSNGGPRGLFGRAVRTVMRRTSDVTDALTEKSDTSQPQNSTDIVSEETTSGAASGEISSDSLVQSIARGAGSILLSDVRLDLRQLVFGILPFIKRITPGGPLILEPFKATITGSFNSKDIQESFLLDAGLRRLTARALRRRVRSFRDLTDGAMFFGRNWNMASTHAPKVEIPRLTSVEFDKQDRLIMTGVAQVRYSPETPVVENKFKVRTKIGTRKNGQSIRLVNPELAFVLECPEAWEQNIVATCNQFNIEIPTRPEPLYSFFPIYSPFKVDDNDGFDLGPDNRIKSIYIEDNALRFEMSAVLRPGRFLGSHYLAFTIPQRTFIITMDKVREGIRTARRNKRAAVAAAQAAFVSARKNMGTAHRAAGRQSPSEQELVPKQDLLKFTKKEEAKDQSQFKVVAVPSSNGSKSFFSRFVEGYTGIGKEENERNARLTIAISDWFGKQGSNHNSVGSPRRQEV